MNGVEFKVIDTIDDAMRDAVHDQLRQFNQTENPSFWAVLESAEHAARPLNVIALDAAGRLAGGLFAETRLAWMKLAIMAVRQNLRRQGIGKRLLLMAEAEALNRGCKYVFADTMDYQAPGFYHRLGFSTAGRIEDWDSHGHAKIFLVKLLNLGPGMLRPRATS
jgi:GNAT superfamily N-acetyltransferase